MPHSARRDRALQASTPARPSSLRTAGIGPIPITRGSTPATAPATKAPSGSTPSSRALLLRRDHERGCAVVQARRVARGDGAVLAERRLQGCELLERSCPGADARRARSRRPARARRRNDRPRLQRPSAPATRARTRPDPRARHRIARRRSRRSRPSTPAGTSLRELRVREPPAERRVVERRGLRAETPCRASP